MNAVVYPTDFSSPRKTRRLSREAIAAVGLSAAVHVVVIGYIATEKFKEIQLDNRDHGSIQIEAVPREKPPPPPKDLHQPPKAVAFHEPKSDIQPPPEIPPVATAIVPQTQSADPPVQIAQTTPPPVTQLASAIIPPPTPKERLIRNPTWMRKPTGSEMEKIYPRRAMELEKSGGATLMCTVAASGSVGGCSVIDESPKGLGFGDAAVAAAKFFKLSPRTVDGDAVEGAKVRIPLVFNLAN